MAYLFLNAFLAVFISNILIAVSNQLDKFKIGLQVGNIVAIVSSVLLSFLILKQKRLFVKPIFLILTLLAGPLAYYGGGLLGLLPAAYLSTR